jgi:hypothetical protein
MEIWERYLGEHYLPGADVRALRGVAARVRSSAFAMSREGKALRHVDATIVPHDEAVLSVFDAAGEELVREAYERAGVQCDRISHAISAEG